MINVEGRIREERPSKGLVRPSKTHLQFTERGIVGVNDGAGGGEGGSGSTSGVTGDALLGKKRVEPKKAEEHKELGRRVVSEEELKQRFGPQKRGGKQHLQPYKVANDGEEKPVGPPPGANLTSRQRAEKIVREAVSADPALDGAVKACIAQKGEDTGVFEAVRIVQRHEAAKNVEKRDTTAAHLRSDDEPSRLAAPFAQKTTQAVTTTQTKFHKRMLDPPAEPEERAQGIKKFEQEVKGLPFDTKIARFYPDPPAFGKGREIWSAQGKRRCELSVAPHDLDELAVRKAVARCGASSGSAAFPEFVLGTPDPLPNRGKNSSPTKNNSHFSLGNNYPPAAGMPSPPRPATASASAASSVAASSARPTRNMFAHLKNASTSLW
jgi:hypothetical protein